MTSLPDSLGNLPKRRLARCDTPFPDMTDQLDENKPWPFAPTEHAQSFFPVNFCRSEELRGDSSSSDHLSSPSPTAKIVSPSKECLGLLLSLMGLGGTGDNDPGPPLSPRPSGERASSSSKDPPKEAISKPSSSCASYLVVSLSSRTGIRNNLPHHSSRSADCSLLDARGTRRMQYRPDRLNLAIHPG